MPLASPQYTQNIRDQFVESGLAVGWPRKFFTFSLFVFILVTLVYAGLAFGYRAFLNGRIEATQDKLEELSNQVTDEQRENLITLYSQVANMRDLLGNHKFASNVFALLETVTGQKVVYISFDLDVPDRRVSLEGVAGSYEDLVAQLVLYENAPEIEQYTLKSSNRDGQKVRFAVDLKLSSELLLNQK
ncbi:MAG: hypothetical protein A2Y84_00170 [Candidatus Colwellbacteria bacterium RBG_13_48_8]|uniref:PilN domain-containing protein n=1 Tax=Candidatus Colwellbacteria bacterium RBG_13_48_8 TaxID=1797685 RepID=A0A1G1Z025_9BACT|nr:MAG: hypothetical protein A2Y84_00170 [Candidatus Colwellbacteria bacterium RBG_13_48_8]